MQEAQLRLGIVMVLALLAVSLVLRFWQPDPEPTDTAETQQVWKVDPADVTSIEVNREKGKLVLALAGTDWVVKEPFEGAADAHKTKDLINDVTDIATGIPIDAADGANYGLGEPPHAKVVVTLKDGKTQTILIGAEAPGGHRRYVRVPDGPITAVGGSISSLDDDAMEFRDRRVINFAIGDVVHAQIAGPNGTLSVSKVGQQWWVDGFTRADDRKLEDLFLAMLDLQFDRIAPADVVPITDGEYDVSVQLTDGKTVGIHVSAPDAVDVGEPGPVTISADGGQTGTLASGGLAFLGQGPVDVGDASAFPVDRTAAKHVEITLGDASMTIDADGDDAWTVAGKPSPRTQPTFDAIADTSIHYRREPVPAITEKYGTIRVKLGSGERAFDVGQVVDGSFRVVQDEAGGQPYLVPVDQINAIVKAMTSATG